MKNSLIHIILSKYAYVQKKFAYVIVSSFWILDNCSVRQFVSCLQIIGFIGTKIKKSTIQMNIAYYPVILQDQWCMLMLNKLDFLARAMHMCKKLLIL